MKNLRNKLNEEVRKIPYRIGNVLNAEITPRRVGALTGIAIGIGLGYCSASCEGSSLPGNIIMTALNPITYIAGFLFGTSGYGVGLASEYNRNIENYSP